MAARTLSCVQMKRFSVRVCCFNERCSLIVLQPPLLPTASDLHAIGDSSNRGPLTMLSSFMSYEGELQ